MKKILLTLICGSVGVLYAQKFQPDASSVSTSSSVDLSSIFNGDISAGQTEGSPKSTVCSDNVRYGDKGTAQPGGDVGETFWGAFQIFPGYTGQITGATFNGNSLSGPLNSTDSFALVIYNIYYESVFDAYCPTGSPLGGAYIAAIGTATQDYSVTFASPVNITNPEGFAVALACYGSGDSVNINMSPNNSGNGGHFSFMTGGGSIYSLYMSGYDTDFMIYPQISFTQPTIGLNVSSNSICDGDNVSFTNTPSISIPNWYDVVYGMASGSPISMYNSSLDNNQLWSYDYGDGSALAYSNTQSGANHTYNNVGNYTAELALNYQGYTNNCKSVSTEIIDVNGPPSGGFTWESTGLTVEFNEVTQGSTSFSWNFGDGGSSGASNPFHTYASSGTYTVELTATNACGSELIFLNITISDTTNSGNVGLSENELSNIKLYPNPSTGEFNIEVEGVNNQLTITDMLGKILLEKDLIEGKNTIDFGNEATGVYMLVVKNNANIVLVERLVVQ